MLILTKPCLPPAYPTKQPQLVVPAMSCDSHTHIFDSFIKYPLSANRSFTPPEAPVEKLREMLNVIGVERAVIVHSSAYGTDTSATLAAVKTDPKRLRGVAVTGPYTPISEIKELDKHGFSGSRLSTVVRGTPGFESLEAIADNIKPFGWHIAVHVNNSIELTDLAPRLLKLDMTIVVDHIARVRSAEGVNAPGFITLLKMLETGRCWVKLSALHRCSLQDYPCMDMKPFIDQLLEVAPHRVVWGTDWPHVNQFDKMQNDGDILDALNEWVPNEDLKNRILVDNPAVLYRFG